MDGPETSKRSICLVLDTAEIAARRHCNQQLCLQLPINLKSVVRSQEFTNGRLWVVVRSPGAVGEKVRRHLLYHGIKYNEVTATRNKRRVDFQLSEYVVVRVIRIQDHQYRAVPLRF